MNNLIDNILENISICNTIEAKKLNTKVIVIPQSRLMDSLHKIDDSSLLASLSSNAQINILQDEKTQELFKSISSEFNDVEVLDEFFGDTEAISRYTIEDVDRILPILRNEEVPDRYKHFFLNYPEMEHFEKPILQGTVIHKCKNRFQRDSLILMLEQKYTSESEKDVREIGKTELSDDEAIIVSDGSSKESTVSYCYYYMDNKSILRQSGCCTLANDVKCTSSVAEIIGALNAIKQCVAQGKHIIKYYFDNSVIINVFKSHKLDNIAEIREYKDYLNQLNAVGYEILFCDLHPKTDKQKYKLNKALTYIHNSCDSECIAIAKMHYRNYAKKAMADESKGNSLSRIVKPQQPKQTMGKHYDNTSSKSRRYYQSQGRR